MNTKQVFEVTVVKTATLSITLEEVLALSCAEGLDQSMDPKELVEVAISYAEGNEIELDFDREIFVHEEGGSHVGAACLPLEDFDPGQVEKYSEGWGAAMDAVLGELKRHDTGHWAWDAIHCCLTGKDDDLNPWGKQGISLLHVGPNGVEFMVHGLATFPGSDVCFNEPEGTSDEDSDKYLDIWLDQAQLVVDGCGSSGEWTGTDWSMFFRQWVFVPWVKPDGEIDFAQTVMSIISKERDVIRPWEQEIELAGEMLDKLAGWKDADGKRCDSGRPDVAASVFNPIYNQGANDGNESKDETPAG